MRTRQRHFTLANSNASACWDSRPLTNSDNTSIQSWTDRISSINAQRSSNPPVVRTNIQGGQPIVRFTTNSLETSVNNITRNKGNIVMVSVASSTLASGSGYQTISRSRAGTANDRCAVYLRQSKAEAGGRRLDANSYQFVQGGTTSNDVFYIVSGFWDYANAQLTVYQNGTGTSRSSGFQTGGNTSDTESMIEIGAVSLNQQPLNGDVGLLVFIETTSMSLRRRFEHAAAYSFKTSCN